jgi:hypothetical protein
LSPNQTCSSLYVPSCYHTRIEAMTFGSNAKTNEYKIINFLVSLITAFTIALLKEEPYTKNRYTTSESILGGKFMDPHVFFLIMI